MRFPSRISACILLAATLALGCRHPARNSDDSYHRWEWATHRQHRALNMRTKQEQQDYRNWLAAQAHNSP